MGVSLPQIGIESYSVFEAGQQEPTLPGRYALLPDGKPVENHLENLFDLRPTQKLLEDFIRPRRFDTELLRPTHYRQLMDSTLRALNNKDAERTNVPAGEVVEAADIENSAKIQAAIALLEELNSNQQWLAINLSLLIKA